MTTPSKPDPKQPAKPVQQVTENPPPVDWTEYLDRPEYKVGTRAEAMAQRPMLYDKDGKYVGNSPLGSAPPTAAGEPPATGPDSTPPAPGR